LQERDPLRYAVTRRVLRRHLERDGRYVGGDEESAWQVDRQRHGDVAAAGADVGYDERLVPR
jgi:hypothetical protein